MPERSVVIKPVSLCISPSDFNRLTRGFYDKSSTSPWDKHIQSIIRPLSSNFVPQLSLVVIFNNQTGAKRWLQEFGESKKIGSLNAFPATPRAVREVGEFATALPYDALGRTMIISSLPGKLNKEEVKRSFDGFELDQSDDERLQVRHLEPFLHDIKSRWLVTFKDKNETWRAFKHVHGQPWEPEQWGSLYTANAYIIE